MFDDYQIPTRPMTVDDAFTVIVETMRERLCPGEALNAISFDTTVFEWELMVTGVGDIAIPEGFNAMFGTAIAADAWKAVLEPARERTLGDVCRLVADHGAVVPVIEPLTVMGDRSHAAGAFLAVRRILQDEGVDVSDLRPSSPIAPHLREKWASVVPRLRRLAPGRLPPVSVVAPAHVTSAAGIFASYVVMMLGLMGWLPVRITMGGVVCMVGFIVTAVLLDRHVKPADVRLGAARTFRDLCHVLAGDRDAWPGFPVTASTR